MSMASQYNEVLLEGEGLNLFNDPPIHSAFEKVQYVYYHPVAPYKEDAPLEFMIPPSGKQYINLQRSFLIIKAKIVKGDGSE